MNKDNEIDKPSRSQILDIVISSLEEVSSSNSNPPASTDENTRLIGQSAILDSMGLVSLIVDVEQIIDQDFGITLILADERAMSQKHSPFRSVQSLADYIVQLIEEQFQSEAG
jgi:acyl carrier protein